MEISIREIWVEDAGQIVALSEQLGYTMSLTDTQKQIEEIVESKSDKAFVAIDRGKIIGWMHVFYTSRLESKSFCEIGGLVVDENCRGRGVGKLLVEQAKQWCLAKGCEKLKVRSNVIRDKAHAFYLSCNFNDAKEQKVFEINIQK